MSAKQLPQKFIDAIAAFLSRGGKEAERFEDRINTNPEEVAEKIVHSFGSATRPISFAPKSVTGSDSKNEF